MKTLTMSEWRTLYRRRWRLPFENCPKEIRQRLVRGCEGKAIYDSFDEALKVVNDLSVRDGFYPGAYRCPLCAGIHIGNSKDPRKVRAEAPEWLLDALELGREIRAILPLMYRYAEMPFERKAWIDAMARD